MGIGFLVRDIKDGIERQTFAHIDVRVAVDLVVGAMFSAAHALSREALASDYPEAIVSAMLRGLGLSEDDARRCIALPLPEVDLRDESVLGRTLDLARELPRQQ
jgi:hypothetical protein